MREKILVLEDDENLRAIVVESLEDLEQSFQIVDVGRPEEAMEAARHTRFDLMLTDVRMAGCTDGLGALAEVKKHCPSIYSIVMTGYMHEDRPEVRAMRCGTDFFLNKPFSLAKLSNAIIQVLATKQSNDTLQQQVKGFFNSAKRSLLRLAGKEVQKEDTELERDRNLLFNGYFTAIQTTNLHVSGAIQVWDYLVAFEQEYESLLIDVGEQASELASKYRRLLDFCAELTEKRKTSEIPPREPGQISTELFTQFHTRVLEGAVNRSYLNRAPGVWNLQQDIKQKLKSKPDDKEWPTLVLKIFGEDPVEKAKKEQQEAEKRRAEQQKADLQKLTEQLKQQPVEKPPLERHRNDFFNSYFAAVKGAKVTLFGATWTWDNLIKLERDYATTPSPELGPKYLTLLNFLNRLVQERTNRPIVSRAAYEIEIELFKAFCLRVYQGAVSQSDFCKAPAVWFLDQQIKRKLKPAPADWPKPFSKIFGRDP